MCGAQDAQMARLELHPEEGGTHDCNPGLCNVFIDCWALIMHLVVKVIAMSEAEMDVNLKQINQAFYLTCGLVVKLVAIKHCRKV